MSDYPDKIFDPREKENDPSVEYDEEKKTVIFAEDVQKIEAEIKAIQELLGLPADPQEGTILQRLSALEPIPAEEVIRETSSKAEWEAVEYEKFGLSIQDFASDGVLFPSWAGGQTEYFILNPLDLSEAGSYQSSEITFDTYLFATPDLEWKVLVAVSDKDDEIPDIGDFEEIETSGDPIPQLSQNDNLSGKYLWTRVEVYIATGAANLDPLFDWIKEKIN